MEMEPVSPRAQSAPGSMACPKCGFEQEERLDCRKCGVVFSKFYALFQPGKPATQSIPMDSTAPEQLGQDHKAANSDLQLQIKELSAKFSQVEFEKAERNQLRTDLKNLEQQFQAHLDRMAIRLDQVEKKSAETSDPKPQQKSESQSSEILKRLEKIEDILMNLDPISRQISDLTQRDVTNSRQISELQTQYTLLRQEVLEIKDQINLINKAREAEEPRTPIEEDVRAIRKNLEEFRQFLSKHASS
jgi:chromosome segregation ATPase